MSQRLLIYYPSNKKTNSIKAQINLLSGLGFEVFVLTQEPEGAFHNDIKENKEIKVFGGGPLGLKGGLNFYWCHAKYLIAFCKAHKIEIVFSHLQVANLVSLLASALLPKIKFYYFRHHFQYFKKFRFDYLKPNKNEVIGEKLISLFAKRIVVPSSSVLEGMVEYEGVSRNKLTTIPYIYNFEEYPVPDKHKVTEIENAYPFSLRLLMCSRFIEGKRHAVVFNVLKQLVQEKSLNIGLLLLDEGPLKPLLQQWVKANGLESNIFFIGYVNNIMDYFAAADLLVHPSLTEASNSSVKEMALAETTSIVCTGVGDFDDYIEAGKTGFLIDPLNSEKALTETIIYAHNNKPLLHEMGLKLKKTVINKFSASEAIRSKYRVLLELT